MIHGHGDDLYRYRGRIRHNFSTNIFQGYDHTALCARLAGCAAAVANYPEPEPAALESAIAAMEGVEPGQVCVTAGATGAIYAIAASAAGASCAIVGPTFAEYADASARYGLAITHAGSLEEALAASPALVWVCNPNNPTGTVIPEQELTEAIATHRRTLFVVDAAYEDYTPEPLPRASRLAALPNAIMLHSMTKRFGVPGIRLGYATGAAATLEPLRAPMPWSVGGLTLEAAGWLLGRATEFRPPLGELMEEAARMARAFRALGVEVTPSATPFMLCRLPHGTASSLKEWLVDNYGILVRDASNFHGLTPAHFRVAAQRPEQNDLLINALTRWMLPG